MSYDDMAELLDVSVSALKMRALRAREALLRLMRPFNLTGLPAISVPCGLTRAGLPIGLQIAGQPFDEATVLRVAHAYEQHTDWHRRHPALA